MDDRKRRVDVAPTSDDPSMEDDVRARQIRHDIARTREDLSETVDAIQEKLSPGNLVANAKSATTEKVKDMASNAADSAKDMAATAADTAGEWWEASGGNTVVDRLRNNPIPALMTGVGVAWLIMSNGERYRGNGERYRRYRTASDRTTEWSTETGEGRRMASPNGRSAMRDGVRQIETMVRQYPLAVGAAAVLIGASLGMVVPETERENELMGAARDTALERAQQVATGTVDRVKEAAATALTQAAVGN
jgi:hypothetical protein